MTAAALGPYRVKAFNTAKASENKIHDDAVARRFGFGGGLVPGVDVYAYMAHQPVARWGRAWLERGAAECRFQKPVYDGDIATVIAIETGQGLDLRVESRGEICATGHASLPDRVPAPSEPFADPSPPPADRPPASETTLAAGTMLGIRPLPITRDLVEQCIADLRETEALYLKEGLAHPVIIARTGNWALNHNVVLGPYRVEAFNTAKASENKIHDDAVARRFGFGGGLVPGVDVYAYMAHQPVARWGRAWLERGAAECRFQ